MGARWGMGIKFLKNINITTLKIKMKTLEMVMITDKDNSF